MRLRFHISVETTAEDFAEAARQQAEVEETLSAMRRRFPEARLHVQQLRKAAAGDDPRAGARRLRRATGAAMAYDE